MTFCIPQGLVDRFKTKLKSGEIDPAKLSDMTSAERRTMFEEYFGPENAKQVNALFESKLLLKNQQEGIISWAKKVVGLKPDLQRDIVSRANRMTEILQPKEFDKFLSDIVEQRLGFRVTQEQAANIAEMSKHITESRKKIPEDAPEPSRTKEGIEYGTSLALFKDYVAKLKMDDLGLKYYSSHPLKAVKYTAGVTKSMTAALDLSASLRQGLPTLFSRPDIWARNFIKQFNYFGKELVGKDAMLPIKAEVYARRNALNSLYEKMKLDIGILTEEAFPSSLPERIPGLGRAFKGSESAFNGLMLRMRADLADRFVDMAQKQGVNIFDKHAAESLGSVINSMTGRGKIKMFTPEGQEFINATMFSPKFVKSHFDILTQPFNRELHPFARKIAAQNLLRIVGSVGALMTIANILIPGSVDEKNIGKIKIGSSLVNISGGLGAIPQLAYNIYKKLKNQNGKYGEYTAWDTFLGFFENRFSPLGRVVQDYFKGEHFGGERFSWKSALKNSVTPLSLQTMEDILNSKDGDKVLLLMILDGLGAGVTPPRKFK